ncbi:MAG: YqiA/YcfP family alpha/beta fold hydrolase, partial [Microcoleaceae cyanobacterium]
AHLTLSRQLAQIGKIFREFTTATPVTVIGSSFGGLTAAYLAEYYPQVERLILLAPAFNFLAYWLSVLGSAKLQAWQKAGSLAVYHYIAKKEICLNYDFIEDMYNHDESILRREIPTLIFHGVEDTTIPLVISQQYASLRPWVKLIELSDDHSLHNSLEDIWSMIEDFCQLSNKTN